MDSQEIEQQVKAGYDQFPYPGIDTGDTYSDMNSMQVNIDWIGALMSVVFEKDPPFKHILVAGCGTGNEAFRMCNYFPEAEVTAVDFSEESIRVAKEFQSAHPEYANVRFEVGNLTVETDEWAKADHYDFISCHGVVTYIPNTQDVFDIFAKCLSKNGILYLGVNGAAHIGVKIRKSFEYFGSSPVQFDDTIENRRLLELFDRLSHEQTHVTITSASYIDADILNSFSLDLTLSEWTQYTKKAGLHLLSGAELIPGLAKTLSPSIFPLLFPKSRKELCELIEINNTETFHRLIFSKSAPPRIPWDDPDALFNCEFQTTQLYTLQNPISDINGELFLSASTFSNGDTNFRWSFDDITQKLLQQYEGSLRIKDALKEHIEVHKNNLHPLLIKLFMFYQLGMIKILPASTEQSSDNESQDPLNS